MAGFILWFFTLWGCLVFPSVQFSHSVMSDSLQPHESQHARPPCPSPTPWVHSDSRPSSQWCHPAISSYVIPFSSCLQSLRASETSNESTDFRWVNSSHEVAKVWEFFPSSMFLFMKNLYYLTYCSKKFMNLRKKKPVWLTNLWNIFDIYLYTILGVVFFSLCAVNSSVPFLQRPTNIRQCLSVYFYSHLLFTNSLL